MMAFDMNRRIPFITRVDEPRLRPEEAVEAFKEITETLEKAFNTENESGTASGVNWPSIKACLRTIKRYFHELKLFWKTIFTIFEYFEERRDPELSHMVADVLHFALFEGYYAYTLLPARDMPRVPSILSDSYKPRLHNVILELMRQPYRVYRSAIIPEANVVWNTVKMDSEKFLPLLLRQGVVYIPPSSHVKEWEYCERVLNNICHFEGVFQTFDSQTVSNKLRPANAAARRRIFTVFRGMDIALCALKSLLRTKFSWEGEVKGNYRDRYCMLFDSIPEPFVTLQEVRSILGRVLDPVHTEAMNSYCEKFKDIMPESVEPITPRSLKHLSRCQVRENLRIKGVFPYGVYKMPIPNILKRYLLLEDWYAADGVKQANLILPFPDSLRHEQYLFFDSIQAQFIFSFPLISNYEFEVAAGEDRPIFRRRTLPDQ